MSEVPEGTIDDVMEWVGDDAERAKLAYTAEVAGKGRTTLLDKLTAVAGEPTDGPAQPEAEEPEDLPAIIKRKAGKTFVANKRLRYQGKWYEPGDVIPGADTWPRVESWLRQGYIKEQS